MKTSIIFFLLGIIPLVVTAQTIRLTRTEQQGDNIIIWYDLAGSSEGQLFRVEIFGSHNNFSKPLGIVSGDVGPNIRPGNDKKITWNAKADIINFTGTIEFRIKAAVQYSPLGKLAIAGSPRLKRGKAYQVTWEGGEPEDILTLELYGKEKRIYLIPDLKNTGAYDWAVPKNIRPGNRYKFMMRPGNDPNSGTVSETFKIKRRMPRVLFVVPAMVLAGGIIYYIIQQSNDKPLPQPPANPDKL
ncbi:MAG TPA: hypothetical protein VI583_01455 [Cyclobacteriaceae bacterium]|nr:hypothetical protein [Cyclobacteriaceae bacterium]